MNLTKLLLGIVAAVGIGAAYLLIRNNQALRAEFAAVQAELAARDTAAPVENPSTDELQSLRQDRMELMNLRKEVERLREAQRRLSKLQKENEELRKALAQETRDSNGDNARDYQAEMEQGLAVARMHFSKAWMVAFQRYASEHDDQLPHSFEEAMGYFPKEAGGSLSVLDPNRFEIMYSGSLKDIPNPARIILIRERESFQHTSADTGTPVPMRTYAFADGHSELHTAPDGDFEKWEREHMMPAP